MNNALKNIDVDRSAHLKKGKDYLWVCTKGIILMMLKRLWMVSVFRSQQRKSQVIKRAPHVYHYICTLKSQLPSYCVDGSASFARYICRYFCLKYSKLLLNLYRTIIQIIILVGEFQINTFILMTCCYRSKNFFHLKYIYTYIKH